MNLSRLWPLLVAILLIYVAFRFNVLLGIVVAIGLLGFALWTSRSTVFANKAMEASNKGDMKEAIRWIEQAVKANGKQPVVMASYAYLLLRDGQIDKAEKAIKTAEKLDKSGQLKTNTRITRSLILWKQGKIDEAIENLEQLQSQIQNTNLYGSLGHLYVERGDLDKALEYNLEAVEYNDTDGVILDNLLTTHIHRQEWEEAEKTLEKLMALSPKFPEAFYHSALVKEHRGDLSGALEDCDRALARNFTALNTESREKIAAFRDQLAARLGQHDGQPDDDGGNGDNKADTEE